VIYDYILFLLNFYSYFYKNIIFSETLFFQLIILIISIYFYNNDNIYYMLLYLFFYFFLLGVFLSYWQVEFFTGFLWLIELTILFVFLLILFFLNFKGTLNNVKKEIDFFKKLNLFFIFFFINIYYFYDSEFLIINELNFSNLWEDYYECLKNFGMNDFKALLISYYYYNSVEFITLGIILFIGSVVCVNLFKVNKNDINNNINDFINIFDFFLNNISFVFLRKQNLTNQNLTLPSVRFLKKKS